MADPQYLTIPPTGVVSITPSDSTPLNLRGVYVGGTGDVVVKCVDGSTGTYKAVPVGTQLVGQFVRIMAATTATNLLGQV